MWVKIHTFRRLAILPTDNCAFLGLLETNNKHHHCKAETTYPLFAFLTLNVVGKFIVAVNKSVLCIC
jgi:hypothetical protein